jgi:hypothetical protein
VENKDLGFDKLKYIMQCNKIKKERKIADFEIELYS